MKNYVRLFVALALVTILVLTACSGGPAPSNTGAIPDSLQTIEAAAEDIIDLVPSGNWDKINTDVQTMVDAWEEFAAQSDAEVSQELKDAMVAALEQLQIASQAQDAAATLQASNDVSAAVVELFAHYATQIPADISRLDVLERQVILDVSAQDYATALTTFNTIKTTWEKVKPSVMEHNGDQVIADFEASLATQESALSAKDAAALTNEARLALELVDALENLFR